MDEINRTSNGSVELEGDGVFWRREAKRAHDEHMVVVRELNLRLTEALAEIDRLTRIVEANEVTKEIRYE